ncbi:MAG: glycosyl transferase group 1 [Candidatus Saccharibacteria bacterium]|nr:glycosyl transferase group 1 [Candidatus Saccharibacteria bacterium]
MKFFVESHTILKNKSGVGWFTHGLIKGMQSQLTDKDSIHLLTHPAEAMDIDDLLENSHTFDHPIDWMPARLYHALKFRNTIPPVDLVYGHGLYIFPNFIRWPLAHSPSVIVVHDLSMFDIPEYSSPKNVEFMTRHLPNSIAKADLIVAVSNSTKESLCNRFNVDPNKVVVAYLAAEPNHYRRTDEEIATVKAKYGIFGKYMLFVSTLEPRKNIEGIVRAYRALPKKLRDEYSLVLAGGWGWRDEAIREAIQEARMAGDRVVLTGYIDTDDKPALYSGATAFIWPSHYEGFGLPVVEAMSCGTPVLTANNSSLPEAGGDAALYVDSTSHEQLVEGMKQLLTDEHLRKQLIAKGYKQAGKFSWDTCAQTVLVGIHKHKLI